MHRFVGLFFASSYVVLFFAMPVRGQYIVAHRGASHAVPENTLAAFDLAWREEADGIEGDFRLTADGQIVCMHDADTERTAGRKLVVAESTLAELQQLDVGVSKHPRYANERIPTLAEVLDSVPKGKLFFIELKTGPQIVQPLQKVLLASQIPLDQLVIIAFDESTIRQCKKLLPNIKAHWLTGYKERPSGSWEPTVPSVVDTLARTSADGLGSQANRDVFNQQFVAALKRQGMGEFHVWTVDEPEVAKFYIDLGAWSITTNRPSWLREQLGAGLR